MPLVNVYININVGDIVKFKYVNSVSDMTIESIGEVVKVPDTAEEHYHIATAVGVDTYNVMPDNILELISYHARDINDDSPC